MITSAHISFHSICPCRNHLDEFGDRTRRAATSAFSEMLWTHQQQLQGEALAELGNVLRIESGSLQERLDATAAAMSEHTPLIYQGCVTANGRLASPPLFQWAGSGYRAVIVKTGKAFDEAGRPLSSCALALAHATSVLDDAGLSDGSGVGLVLTGAGGMVECDLNAPSNSTANALSWMDLYRADTLPSVAAIVEGRCTPRPALSALCKQCPWSEVCVASVVESNDLSLIAELGRAKRDVMLPHFPDLKALAAANLEDYAVGKKKTIFRGIGPATLAKYQLRAKLLTTPGATPVATGPIMLPDVPHAVMFDIEDSPVRDFVYLHGFVEAPAGCDLSNLVVRPCLAKDLSPAAEESAFKEAWTYMKSVLARGDTALFYYSPHEHVVYRELASRYPAVCSVDEVDALFADPLVVDLYTTVVRPHTEWPLPDKSIKTLAKYLGFNWRDTDPSGANSIEWYEQWIATGDEAKMERLVVYNTDDNIAVVVLLNALRAMQSQPLAA